MDVQRNGYGPTGQVLAAFRAARGEAGRIIRRQVKMRLSEAQEAASGLDLEWPAEQPGGRIDRQGSPSK